MRTLVLCLAGTVAGITAFNIVGPATGTAIMGDIISRAAVDRSGKSDRANTAPVTEPKKTLTTIEVIGVEQIAVVYRDREGRVLFSSDPLRNTTVVVRGTELPQVTVRSWTAETVQPKTFDVDQPAQPSPVSKDEKLPDGCEPAASLLSPSGSSALRARCLASLVPTRVASAQ